MKKSHLLLAIFGQVVLFNLICMIVEAASFDEDEVFRRYRPLAMDESWEVSKNPRNIQRSGKVISQPRSTDVEPEFPPLDEDDLDGEISDIGPSTDKQLLEPNLINVEDSRNLNASNHLFRLPMRDEETPSLTRLISGNDRATLVQDQITNPVIIGRDQVNSKSKILATYRILVPIFVPAIKLPPKIPDARSAPIKYVKEVHTEMVPVKKSVSRVKNVIKAERVPQQIITDYVKADGTSVPSSVDDKLKPDEQVLRSVVTNFD